MKSKRQKREEAQIRQDNYDALSLDEKLARITGKPGNSTKELVKIAKRDPSMELV